VDTATEAAPSGSPVEILVTNNGEFPIIVEAYWEHSPRVRLGDVLGRGQSRTFVMDDRDEGFALFVRDQTGGVGSNMRTRDRPALFANPAPGDRLMIVVERASPAGEFFLPLNLSRQ
jgi:hypothetical protein